MNKQTQTPQSKTTLAPITITFTDVEPTKALGKLEIQKIIEESNKPMTRYDENEVQTIERKLMSEVFIQGCQGNLAQYYHAPTGGH